MAEAYRVEYVIDLNDRPTWSFIQGTIYRFSYQGNAGTISEDEEWVAETLAALNPTSVEDTLAEALKVILVRCEEGDKRTNWLPTITSISRHALALYEANKEKRDATG